MDFITRKAKDFISIHFLDGMDSAQTTISEVRHEISDIDNTADKIKFLNLILEKNNSSYAEHLKVCRDKEECSFNYKCETIAYYLSQELGRLGVHLNEDTFTEEEKVEAETKLNQLLKDLDEVKLGQQIIFEELTELRELFFLGKKKWYQLVAGKSIDMVTSGIISETVSKQIIEGVRKAVPHLLNQ